MSRNVLVVLSGPSGVGKGTIAAILKERGMNLSVSCTTRAPRKGETDGKDYFFLTVGQFKSKIESGGFLEYSSHMENYYGTPKDYVLSKLKTGDVLLEIDVNGGLAVKKAFPSAVLIMLAPPSPEEIKRRLLKRGTESEEKIAMRMSRMEYELSKSKEYDYVVVNGDLDEAVREVEDIIASEKERQ